MNNSDSIAVLKYQVYRIDKSPTRGNHYGIDREEAWGVEIDAAFSSHEEAREYIIRMNRKYCGYELGILYSNDQSVITQRCTDSKWCHLQRYFIGRPNMDLIAEKLRKDHINVIRRKQPSKL